MDLCRIKKCQNLRSYGFKYCDEHKGPYTCLKCTKSVYKDNLCSRHNPVKRLSRCVVCHVISTSKLLGGQKCKRCTANSKCAFKGCIRSPSIRGNVKTKVEVEPGVFVCINDGMCCIHRV